MHLPWYVLALVLMAMATVTATATAFYLYRWRRILLSNPHMLVPEELGRWLQALGAHVHDLHRALSNAASSQGSANRATNAALDRMTETFMTMQHALDVRDAEVQRLRAGYDTHVFRKFVARFLRVDQALRDFQDASREPEPFAQARVLLQDALEECGVEPFEPSVGDDYRRALGVADHPKTRALSAGHQPFEIAEVLEPGYRIAQQDGGYDVVREATVTIFSETP